MKKKKYTMTRAAHAQRVAAARKRKSTARRGWTTICVAKDNADYCKSRFGTANEALNTLRAMTEGGASCLSRR